MKKNLIVLSLLLSALFGRINAQCNWVSVSPSDSNQIAFGETFYNAIAVDPNTNIAYVAYRDGTNYFGASVKKYVNGFYTQVGRVAFSKGDAKYESVTVSKKTGKVYIAYQDGGYTDATSVCTFDGTKWDTLSQSSFPLPGAYQSIATDTNGVPYVAFEDFGASNKAAVMMYNGTKWVQVGSSLTISSGQALYTTIGFDRVHNQPYVAYENTKDSNRLMVMYYNGTSWGPVGGATYAYGMSPKGDTVQWVSMTFDKAGHPYVSYQDMHIGGKSNVIMYNGTAWANVGASGFSGGQVNYTSIGVDRSSNVYVSYEDFANYDGLTTMKYNGTSWSAVGSKDISAGTALYVALAIDTAGAPVVTYQDKGTQHHGETFKYTKGEWKMFGSIGLSDTGKWNGMASYTSLALSPVDTPYIAYRDGNNYYGASVKAFDGTKWHPVGVLGNISTGTAEFTNISFDKKNGNPIIAYTDSKNTPKYGISVKEFSGGTWNPLGSVPSFSNYAYYLSMAVSSADTIYISFQNTNYGLDVMKYNGTAWVLVGSASITGDTAAYTSIAIDKNGTPYVAFSDYKNAMGVTVMKYTGGNWVTVGTANISAGESVYPSIQIDPKDNMPVVAYSSYAGGAEANVQKFDGTSWKYIGLPAFSHDWSNYMSFTIAPNGSYHVLYEDWGDELATQGAGNCTSEMYMLPDTSWQYQPVNGSVSNGGAGYVSLTTDSKGVPYAAWSGYGAFVAKLPVCNVVVTGVDNITAKTTSGAEVYPNPSHGIYNVALTNVTGVSYMDVYNMLGEKINHIVLNNTDNTQFNLSAKGAGVYLYRIYDAAGNPIATGKLILQ